MSRIAETFAELRSKNRKGFIPFITAGDPDLDTTRKLIVELARVGSTLIELGIPFTDPMADGPVIQRASERALRLQFGLEDVLRVVSAARHETDIPIILFSYFNPLLQFGVERLAREARNAGIDGVLVTDMVPEEAGEFAGVLKQNELDMIFLIAPTSTDERLQLVAKRAGGFIYAVSRAGITGAREEMSAESEKLVRRMRTFSDLPIAVGFGISKPEHVADVWRYADAAVVGSAIVDRMEKAKDSTAVVKEIGDFTASLITRK